MYWCLLVEGQRLRAVVADRPDISGMSTAAMTHQRQQQTKTTSSENTSVNHSCGTAVLFAGRNYYCGF